MWPPTGLIPWFSKTEGNTYANLLHHPFLFKGKPTQCSRGSKKDVWRHCRGDLRTSQDIPSSHRKLLSLALHYLPFASRFPLPTSPLPFYSPSFSVPLLFSSSSLFACLLCACVLDCLSRWLKIILNCVTFQIPTIMTLLALRFLPLPMLNLVKLILLC